jgi:Ca2+-binding EF-hand superfamily protein
LKLVKTGCDYQKTFIEFAEKVCKRKNNQDINLYGSVEDKNKVLSEIYLSKNQTNELLLQMGISMKQSDLLILIDSFDVNGDGKITLQEFMDFVGPKRATNSGSSVILSQKCVWFTTCRETGMANAYSVTNVIKNKEAPSAEAKDIREGNDQLDEKSSYLEPTFVDKTKIESDNNNSRNNLTFYKTLKSGQRRLYIENNERKLRLSVLKKCGLLKQERKNSNLSADSKANAEDENYQDHFEDYQDEDNEDGVNVSKNMKDDTRKTGCSYIRQSAEDKLKALKLLAEESKINRKEKLVQNLMTEGSPPQPPKFWVICDPVVVETKESGGTSTRQSSQRSNAKNYILNSKSRLEIHWEPSKSDDVISFYTIDCSGPTNNRSVRGDNFKEIYRDPPDAHPNNKAKTCYLFDNLQFGTSYSFRIRAYNGFGPSEYVYKVFTTLCNQPLTPNIISCSSSSVELRWLFDEIYMQEMIKLKSIFRIIDKDGSGTITREELVAVLDDKSSDVIGRDSRKFLKKVSKSLGLDPNQGYAALFDMIESDDDGVLTWQEFEQFFLNAGWITSCVPDSSDDKSLDIISSLPLTLKNDNNNNSNNDDVHSVTSISSRGINSRMNVSRRQGTSLRSKFTPNRSVSKTDGHILAGGSISSSSHSIRSGKPQLTSTRISTCPQVTKKITYVIEQCISDIDNSYKEVLKTSSGYGIISNLQPGTSYRFRVYAMNCEGQKSSPSNSVVVHTLLITPSPPTPVDIKPNQILLKWKPLNSQENRRSKDTIDKVLTDWASLHNLKERGVSVEAAFTKYDKDKNGTIDAHELAYLLEDLGINPTEDKLLDALREFDQNGDGLVSFEEFCQWWRKGSIVYTIKISEPILPRSILLSSIDSSDDYDRNINQIDSDKDENDCPEYEDDLSFSLFSDKKEKKQDKKMRALTKPPSYDEIAYKISKLLKNGDSELSSSNIQVPMPTVAYRGGNTKTTVSSLLPNRLYHIKIRASTSYSHSQLSDPLEFMTQPLPIQSQPILVMMSCNTIRIKWYPSKYGAYKYEVQLTKLIEGKSSTTNWTSVYSGLDNNYVNTTMTPGTSYALRVFGINYFGIYSEPSIPLIFTTPDRSISGERLNIPSSKKTTESVFNIECTGDICIGDTILITERLYATKTVSYTPRKSLILPTNASTISEQISQQSIKLKSFRKKNLNNGNRELGKTIQDSISLAEPASITNGVCIGERVITAHVIKDNYRTIREYAPTKFMLQNSDIDQTQQDIESKIKASEDICTKSISKLSNSISKQDCQKVSYNRNLWLEIIWQKTNTTAPIESLKAFELNNGMIIQRIQSDIEQFEIYRQPWVEENKRLPLYQEWTTLSECYIPVNHNSSFN